MSFDNSLIGKLKLIIWDLDDTFWKGTLSEGNVQPIYQNIELVKGLCSRGIISSICSKNDLEQVVNKLRELDIKDFFVFNSINWEPKGQRVKEIIRRMNLRSCNVLFIDDNISNLMEVEYYSEGIMTSFPENCLSVLYDNINKMGKDDSNYTRLNQYKVLEKKESERSIYNSNIEFLRDCNICIKICKDCLDKKERIEELIQRTNQLNFTKKRSSVDELNVLFNNIHYECAYIEACDKFGEYGIIGFYALNLDDFYLEHFVFSCRIMGMGIEQYVYSKLNKPKLAIEGETAVGLNDLDDIDWISIDNNLLNAKKCVNIINFGKGRVLFKGPCDMESSLAFIKDSEMFDTELTYVNDNGIQIMSKNSLFHVIESINMEGKDYSQIIPFWDEQIYSTSLFKKKYDVVFFSTFTDSVIGLYESKTYGFKFCFEDWFIDLTQKKNWDKYIKKNITEEQMSIFASEFRYVGRIAQQDIVSNMVKIREMIPKNTMLVISIPTSFPFTDKDTRKNDRHIYNLELCRQLGNAFKNADNVRLIDFTKYTNSESDFLNTSNHFVKRVYYSVAEEYINIINKHTNRKLESSSKFKLYFEERLESIKNYLREKDRLMQIYQKYKK